MNSQDYQVLPQLLGKELYDLFKDKCLPSLENLHRHAGGSWVTPDGKKRFCGANVFQAFQGRVWAAGHLVLADYTRKGRTARYMDFRIHGCVTEEEAGCTQVTTPFGFKVGDQVKVIKPAKDDPDGVYAKVGEVVKVTYVNTKTNPSHCWGKEQSVEVYPPGWVISSRCLEHYPPREEEEDPVKKFFTPYYSKVDLDMIRERKEREEEEARKKREWDLYVAQDKAFKHAMDHG